jgi:hypothetical protein
MAAGGSSIASSMEKQFADFEKEEQAEREKFFGDSLISGTRTPAASAHCFLACCSLTPALFAASWPLCCALRSRARR